MRRSGCSNAAQLYHIDSHSLALLVSRYEDAKYLKKENTWRDFIACSETLIAEGVTDADRYDIVGETQTCAMVPLQ